VSRLSVFVAQVFKSHNAHQMILYPIRPCLGKK